MINHDTVELLKECNAGIKMGVNSIDEVLDRVKDEKFKKMVTTLGVLTVLILLLLFLFSENCDRCFIYSSNG